MLGEIEPRFIVYEKKACVVSNCEVPDDFPCHGKGDKKKSVYIFAANSPGELDCWLSAINEGIYKRQVVTIINTPLFFHYYSNRHDWKRLPPVLREIEG